MEASDPGLEERIETPERVDLAVDLAGIGSRGLALLLDTMILLVAVALAGIVAVILSMALGAWPYAGLIVLVFLLNWFYFAWFEATSNGQTPGKRAMGLRVQRVGGYPIGWTEALIRNFLRWADALLFYGVGLTVMLISARSQRLGDLAAGTVVVRERGGGLGVLQRLHPSSGEAARSHGGPDLTGEEFETVQDFLERRHGIEPGARGRIAASLAAVLRKRLGERGTMPPEWLALGDEELLLRIEAAYQQTGEDGSWI